MKYLRRHALEGKIKFEVSQEELADAMNISPYSNIDIDKSVKKYFKSKGIRIIDCDLRLVTSGVDWIRIYKQSRKNKWYSWCSENVDKKE